MGRKSSLKKKRHDEEIEKKNHEKDDAEKVHFFTIHRFVQIILSAGAIIVIGVLGQLIWKNLTAPRAIAQYVPADRTALIAEFDTDFERETWMKFLETQMNLNFEKQIQPWIGRKIGLAILENGTNILFIESKNEKRTIEFFQQFQLSGVEEKVEQKSYRGNNYYQFQVGNGSAMGFFGKYLVIAPGEKTIKELIDAIEDEKTLDSIDIYNEQTKKVQSTRRWQSPQREEKNPQFFLYVDPKLVLRKIATLDKKKSEMLQPFLKGFGKQVWSGSRKDGKFMIENFIAVENAVTREPYSRKLFAFAPQDPEFFYGNSNAQIQVEELKKIIPPEVLDAFLETQKKTWIGESVTIQEAISLLEQEYLITKKGDEWRLMTRLSKPQIQEKILEKIFSGSQEEKYKNFVIKSGAIYGVVIGNTAILSTSKEGVQQSIDQFLSGKNTVDEGSEKWNEKWNRVEEIAFAKKEFFTPFFPEEWRKILDAVASITAGWTTEKTGMHAIINISLQQ